MPHATPPSPTGLPRPVRSFLLLAFGITWAIVGIGYALGVRSAEGLGYTAMAALCMLGPAIAAVILQRAVDRAPWSGLGLPLAGTRWKYMALTALGGALLVPVGLLVCSALGRGAGIAAFGEVEVSMARMLATLQEQQAATGAELPPVLDRLGDLHIPAPLLLLLLQLAAIVSAFTVSLPVMLGEELGWRGYLYQHLAGWRPARRILFTGAVWGLWHAPLILLGHNYPEYPVPGIALMVVFCTLLALLFDWSRTRTRSVWGPCVLHGIINGSLGGFVLFAYNGHPLVNSPVGLAGFVAIALVALPMLLDRAYWRSGAVSAN